jgi:predicted metal-dependent hydrolase
MVRFDPFNNRLCRNVRNALSEAFKKALDQEDMQPVERVAGFLRDDRLPVYVSTYIDHRMTAYRSVLNTVAARQLHAPLDIAFVIWDRRLFFETHEYLETYWMAAEGDERKLFQAIIRAAGAYVHLEQGNLTGAKRISAKAVAVLAAHQDWLAPYTEPGVLLDKLRSLDPEPPQLST